MRGALVDGTTPTERTVALIALLHVTGLVTKVLPSTDKKLIKTRAKALTEGDWAAKAVKDAIDEVATATAAAAAAGAAGASGRQLDHPGRPGRGGVRGGEGGQRLMGVQPAGIRHDPQPSAGQILRLLAAAGLRPAEGDPVRGDPGHGDHRRRVGG